MKIFVITLEREPHRRRRFCERNPNLVDRVEFWLGIDGGYVSHRDAVEDGLAKPGGIANYTNRALGNALSHISLWRQIAAGEHCNGSPDGLGAMMVLEDDAIVSGGEWWDGPFNIWVPFQVERGHTEPLDLVMWGYNFDCSVVFDLGCSRAEVILDQDALRSNLVEERVPSYDQPLALYRLLRQFGTPGYTVTPAGARRLLELCVPIANPRDLSDRYGPNLGIDCAMNRAYEHINAYAAFPPTVVTENRRD